MSHPAGKRRHNFYVPSACKNEMNDNLEKRMLLKAGKAFDDGAKFFERQGLLFVRCWGGITLWENADPKGIGRN